MSEDGRTTLELKRHFGVEHAIFSDRFFQNLLSATLRKLQGLPISLLKTNNSFSHRSITSQGFITAKHHHFFLQLKKN
jgi:hypothetical protein